MYIDYPADSVRVNSGWSRPSPDLVEALKIFPVASIGDVQDRFGMMSSNIGPMWHGCAAGGSALTVLTREGDNLAIHRALDESKPGDFLIVNGLRDTERALFGDILAQICIAKGIVGAVLDGAVRDIEAIERLGFPVWGTAVTPAGPTKNGPGEAGTVISCGGVVVNPGDIVLADRDGIVVVSPARAQAMLAPLAAMEQAEEALRTRVRADVQ